MNRLRSLLHGWSLGPTDGSAARVPVTPDGCRYLAMAEGRRVARPFHYRFALPAVCGPWPEYWRAVQLGAVGLVAVAGAWYGGFGWRGLFVAVFVFGCAGVIRFNLEHPVLVDLPAIAIALCAAAAWQDGLWPAAVLLVLVAGSVKETSPVFAALWAWSPLLLVGLIVPAVRHLMRAGPDVLDAENRWILDHPFAASRKYHAGLWSPLVWIWPWGVGLVALADLSPQLVATVAVAYAQCAMATDSVRLYQWAWPVVAVAAAGAVPAAWLVPLAVMHLASPFKGQGL